MMGASGTEAEATLTDLLKGSLIDSPSLGGHATFGTAIGVFFSCCDDVNLAIARAPYEFSLQICACHVNSHAGGVYQDSVRIVVLGGIDYPHRMEATAYQTRAMERTRATPAHTGMRKTGS